MADEFPKTMVHPHARKGFATPIQNGIKPDGTPIIDYQGTPDVLPPVTVNNADQEERHRALGYIAAGEAPARAAGYSEYPVMLVHPEHVPATETQHIANKTEAGAIVVNTVMGTPEVNPPRQANNSSEEATWGLKGYARQGIPDPRAVETAKASPYVPGRVVAEFPKMVNGVVVDPNAPVGGPVQYPKWVDGKVVNSLAEELALRPAASAAPPAAMAPEKPPACVICGGPVSDDEATGEGPMGKYHLSHLARATISSAFPEEQPVVVDSGAPKMTASERAKATWAKRKADKAAKE